MSAMTDEAAADQQTAPDATPVGLDALQQAYLLFRDGFDLPFPPVPRSLVGRMRIVGRGQVGTRTDAPRLDSIPALLAELERGPVPDYLLMGQAGHGFTSEAMHYHLVLDGLAIFLQLRMVSLGAEPEVMQQRIAQAFRQIEALLALAPRNLVIVESDIEGRRIGRLGPDRKLQLESDPAPLATALERLAAGG